MAVRSSISWCRQLVPAASAARPAAAAAAAVAAGAAADAADEQAVREALGQVPQARGLNNHMGSALTEQAEPMGWLMGELKAHQLFFVDSRTSGRSVAQRTAQRVGIASAGRDIFLDNQRDLASINRQFNKLLQLARQRGQAIAIGHPYPETVHYLQQVLPLMEQAGIEVVPVSDLLEAPAVNTADASPQAQAES